MPDLLLELFSEEIPARMQRQAAEDLRRLVTNALVERNLTYEGAQSFVTPRRLTLHVVGLPSAQPNLREERKGPRVGAPDAAIQGFLKSAGLERIEDARIETDPKKGEFYVAVIEKPGRETKDAIAEIIPAIVRSFPWPKSMRWGAASAKPDALRWVRPLRGIVCTLAIPHDASEVVPVRNRRDHNRRRDLRPSFHGARAHPGPPFRRLRRGAAEGQGRSRRGEAQSDHPRRRRQPRLRSGARPWSRTRVFWRKSRGWSNGRSC